MFWQFTVVGLLVALSALYVGRQTWRAWFGKTSKGCHGGCGCAGKSDDTASEGQNGLISTDQLTARLRRNSQ